jgi:hypothetical protein
MMILVEISMEKSMNHAKTISPSGIVHKVDYYNLWRVKWVVPLCHPRSYDIHDSFKNWSFTSREITCKTCLRMMGKLPTISKMKLYVLLGFSYEGPDTYEGIYKTKETMINEAKKKYIEACNPMQEAYTMHESTNPQFPNQLMVNRCGYENTAYFFEEIETDKLK